MIVETIQPFTTDGIDAKVNLQLTTHEVNASWVVH